MGRPPVEVRRAGADDVEELLMLWTLAREELARHNRAVAGAPPEALRPRLRQALADAEIEVLIAHRESRPAGYLLLRTAPIASLFEAPVLQIEHLYVAAEARQHGVAKALIAAVAGIAEFRGVEQVLCNVAPGARDVHRFFARLGFAPLVVRRVAATGTLRRRLAGDSHRSALDDLLSRRRSLRARIGRPSPVTSETEPGHELSAEAEPALGALSAATPNPPTLELPVVVEGGSSAHAS